MTSIPDQVTLLTERLLLRPWRESDRGPFAAMNADPAVIEFFPAVMSLDESQASADRIQAGFVERGWGLWAVEVPGHFEFAGFVGLACTVSTRTANGTGEPEGVSPRTMMGIDDCH